MLIDLGANILPGFVGGSPNIEVCSERLGILYSSGLAAALLTPRYYPAKMSVDEFVALREKVLMNLSDRMPKRSPALYLGCEVYIDERLKYISEIGDLAVMGTRTVLAVMPEGTWETALLDTLDAIRMADYEVLIAHIDRVPDWYADDLFKLGYRGIADVESLVNLSNIFKRKQLLEWIDKGHVVGLATDFNADEKRAHEKIMRIRSILGDKRAELLAESSARCLAGAVQITK